MITHYEVLILAHNEAANIEMAVRSVINQVGSEYSKLDRVTVVSTASTDGTNEIVQAIAAKNPLVQLLPLLIQRGKVFDVNEAVANSTAAILVIMDADVTLSARCISLLVEYLASAPHVGMTVPSRAFRNVRAGLSNLVGHMTAEVQNMLDPPKAGRVLAIRREYAIVDERVSVDDAYQEFKVLAAGLIIVRVPGAIAFAVAPQTLSEYVQQRRRITAQYIRLHAITGYRPSTRSFRQLGQVVLRIDMIKKYHRVDVLAVAILVEALARMLGWYDFHLRKQAYLTWETVRSTKHYD